MPKIQLPPALIEAVKGARVVPFLGAGASKEAVDPSGNRPPDANQLRDALAQHFFGKPIPNRDLMTVAEMAIRNGAGQSLVFDEVRKILAPFEPSDAHRALADFNWRMIATTNYDLLIEHAYPRDIFAHRSMSDADVFDELMIGDEVNFRIRFNRQGPTAVDMQMGRTARPV